MKVALCSDYFYPKIGGITIHIEGLAKCLEKRGHDVIIVTRKAKFDYSWHGLNVVRIGSLFKSSQTIDVPDTLEMERVIRDFKPDIIHSHHAFSPISLYSLYVGRKLGIKTVLTNHSIQFFYDFDILWKPSSILLFPIRQLINNADHIIAVSHAAAQFIRYFTSKDVTVIPNGINVGEFMPEAKEFDGKSILFVGRFVYRKGLHRLLLIMEHVVKENRDANLTVAGSGYLSPILKTAIKTLNLDKNITVKVKPTKSELIKLYQKANVFVMPSVYGESFGIVLLEAMASKTPVVATEQGGIREIISDGETGLLVKKEDADKMCEKILMLLKDRDYCKQISEKAFQKVKEYDWSMVAEKIEKLYEN
ncbi:MAG: glycosyltransferase family 4 protein [Nitrososphaeria archaeon]|nr:glycosyltransferase family 4 protein [Nitrososphaeria archaeon]